MKRLYFVVVLLCCNGFLFAQKSNFKDANAAYEKGNLGQAEKSINLAVDGVDDEKTINDPEVWYLRGQIYQSLYEEKKSAAAAISKDLEAMFESYKKALALANKEMEGKSKDHKLKPDLLARLAIVETAYQKEAETRQRKKLYDKEVTLWERKLEVSKVLSKTDNTVLALIAAAAFNAKDYDKTIKYADLAINEKVGQASPYLQKASAYKVQKKYDDMISTLQKGINAYPDQSGKLMNELVDYYFRRGESEKVLAYFQDLEKKNPSSASVAASMGLVLDKLEQPVKALEYGKKAIASNPDIFITNYCMAIINYNRAVAILRDADSKITDTKKMLTTPNPAANEQFSTTLPYLEKAFKLMPNEKDVALKLQTVYRKLEMWDKATELKRICETLN